jgi:hypothetical protein
VHGFVAGADGAGSAVIDAEQEDPDHDRRNQYGEGDRISTTSGMPFVPVAARIRPFCAMTGEAPPEL